MPRLYLKESVETPGPLTNPPIVPTRATVFISGKRFGSHLRLEFEDSDVQLGGQLFKPADFQKTFEVYLYSDFTDKDTFLYRWGGTTADLKFNAEATTFGVDLVIGPFRSNKAQLHISNGQLENTLMLYFEHYLQACIQPGLPSQNYAPGANIQNDDPVSISHAQANTLAQWSSVMELGYNFADPETPIPFAEYSAAFRRIIKGSRLQKTINANVLPKPSYDARARQIYEKFGILSILDLSIQSEIGARYVLPTGVVAPIHLNADIVCVPTAPNRGTEDDPDLQPVITLLNPLDKIPEAVFNELPRLEAKSLQRNYQLNITADEPIVYQYLSDGNDMYDFIGTLDESFDQAELDAWVAAGADPLRMPLRHSLNKWFNRMRGMFEAILHQNIINITNRTAATAVVTPEDAQDFVKLFPGNPVKIHYRGEDLGFWVTETETTFPNGYTKLTLFDPNFE